MNKVSAVESGYGHIVIDYERESMIATSPQAVESLMDTAFKILNAMTKDLSELTGIPENQIIEDYIQDCKCNLMNESIEVAVKKQCKKEGRKYIEPEPTLIRQFFINANK